MRPLILLLAACTPLPPEADPAHPTRDSADHQQEQTEDQGDPEQVPPGDKAGEEPTGEDTAPPAEAAVDCDLIAANPAWEVCETSETHCAGVFTDGAGCAAYCAAAGLGCTARYGGEPGCQVEPENTWDCDADNGHQSDWCVCGEPAPDDEDCASDPTDPPVTQELGYRDAAYTERHNWVLTCRDYAYTASGDEHESCDPDYAPDGGRTGTATFVFESVPRGWYDAWMGGRHTENRNPAGARFVVDGHAVAIDQRDDADYTWDWHGRWCLEGRVEVVLDSSVNDGSDSVFGVWLEPAE